MVRTRRANLWWWRRWRSAPRCWRPCCGCVRDAPHFHNDLISPFLVEIGFAQVVVSGLGDFGVVAVEDLAEGSFGGCGGADVIEDAFDVAHAVGFDDGFNVGERPLVGVSGLIAVQRQPRAFEMPKRSGVAAGINLRKYRGALASALAFHPLVQIFLHPCRRVTARFL